MSEVEQVRKALEECFYWVWEDANPSQDDDGDYVFAGDTCFGWINVEDCVPVLVSVCAIAVAEVPSSPELIAELNEVNSTSGAPYVYLQASHDREYDVVVRHSMPGAALNRETFSYAVDCVQALADRLGPALAVRFGGRTPFGADGEDEQ